MTVDKEAIEKRENLMNEVKSHEVYRHLNSLEKASFLAGADLMYGEMDKYAASLRKENERLDKVNMFGDLALAMKDTHINELQSSNEAKEKEIRELKEIIKQMTDDFAIKAQELTEALTNTEKAYEIMRDKSEAKEKEIERLKGALQELVSLKVLKDSQGKTEDYLIRQPTAWERAMQALKNKTQ